MQKTFTSQKFFAGGENFLLRLDNFVDWLLSLNSE
jgi:hypothetical protein